jgi:hypothetical protein
MHLTQTVPALSACHPMRAANILRSDRRGQAISGIIVLQYCVVLILERNDRGNWAKDLFARDLHIIIHINKDGWIDEVTFAVASAASRSRLGSVVLPTAR